MKDRPNIDRPAVQKRWHARGFSCGLWIDHSGRTWVGSPHQADQLIMVLSGDVELEIQGKRFRPEIGEEVCIPAQASHTIRILSRQTTRWLYGQKLGVDIMKALQEERRTLRHHGDDRPSPVVPLAQ